MISRESVRERSTLGMSCFPLPITKEKGAIEKMFRREVGAFN